MSENTYGKDLVDSLKEPVLEDPVALCSEAAAEIERLRASEALAVADADALANFSTREQRFGTFEMTWDDYVRARTDAVPALSRAADRRAKRGATT